MSMTTNELLRGQEIELARSRETCGCTFNWDDKFWELCEKHLAELDEQMTSECYFVERCKPLDGDYSDEAGDRY